MNSCAWEFQNPTGFHPPPPTLSCRLGCLSAQDPSAPSQSMVWREAPEGKAAGPRSTWRTTPLSPGCAFQETKINIPVLT